MNRCLSIFILLLVSLSFLGCSNDREKLEAICSDIQEAAQMTDDCGKMAEFLEPRTSEYQTILTKLNQNEPDEAKRKEYVDVVSKCLRGYLEISTGACKDDKAVMSALPRDVK